MDIAVLCTPLALPSQDYLPAPRTLPDGSQDDEDQRRDPQSILLEGATPKPPRCDKCSAYTNPFWGNDGSCNFCDAWHRSIGPTTRGTVEYDVAGAFLVRSKPVSPVSLYAVDATCPHLDAYLPILQEVGVAMGKQFMRQDTSAARVRPLVGVVLVASFGVAVVYRRKKKGSTDEYELELSVMPDVTEEPYCHVPLDVWTWDVSTPKGIQDWIDFTNNLWSLWEPLVKTLNGRNAYGLSGYALSCGGTALTFMADAMEETGGR